MSSRYENSLEHLLDELARIDLLIRMQVLQLRMADPYGADEFRGLYISEEEVDALLTSGEVPGSDSGHPQLDRMMERAAALEAQIAVKRRPAPEAG